MGQIFEFTVNYGRTVNIGNYESLRIDVSAGMKVMPGEDPQKVLEECKQKAKMEAERFIEDELGTSKRIEDYY